MFKIKHNDGQSEAINAYSARGYAGMEYVDANTLAHITVNEFLAHVDGEWKWINGRNYHPVD